MEVDGPSQGQRQGTEANEGSSFTLSCQLGHLGLLCWVQVLFHCVISDSIYSPEKWEDGCPLYSGFSGSLADLGSNHDTHSVVV
jgi:hypothetical protein